MQNTYTEVQNNKEISDKIFGDLKKIEPKKVSKVNRKAKGTKQITIIMNRQDQRNIKLLLKVINLKKPVDLIRFLLTNEADEYRHNEKIKRYEIKKAGLAEHLKKLD